MARSVTRLAGQPARRRCAVPDSTGIASASVQESRSGAARDCDTQGQAGIEPAHPWPSARGKCYAFNITGCSAKCRQSQAKLAWCRHRSGLRPPRPAGSQNPCYVWRPGPPARGAALPRRFNGCLARSRLRRQRGPQPQPLRAPAHPGQSAGAGSCRVPRHSLPAPFAWPPVRPRKRGLPKGQGERPNLAACTVGGKLPPLAQGG